MEVPRRLATTVLAATGLAAAALSPAAAEEPYDPPDTLTKAPYTESNGNSGTVNLLTANRNGPAVVPGKAKIAVSLGDSYISGEAGRWAGNSSGPNWAKYSDALGPTAYGDNSGEESLPQCHRSKKAEINFGAGVTSVNLACSGATTHTNAASKPFKPGIDFTNTTVGEHNSVAYGQALLLQNLAYSNPGRIKMVVLSIGGNDFKFGSIVEACIESFIVPWEADCKDKQIVKDNFSDQAITSVRQSITGAIGNIVQAMDKGGYRPQDWNLVVQTYPKPLPNSKAIQYWETMLRQSLGGCGLRNADLDWADSYALPTINDTVRSAAADGRLLKNAPNIQIMDLTNALVGHRLCERGTTIVGKWPPLGVDTDVPDWKATGAVNLSEWVNQIRATANYVPERLKPYELQESLHPNYWGQLAYQVCLAQIYASGPPMRGGACVLDGPGLGDDKRPKMKVLPIDGWNATLNAPAGAAGANGPGKVRGLRATTKGGGVVVLRWQKPPVKSKHTVYLYRVRRGEQKWYGWTNVGTSTAVHFAMPQTGRYTVQVVANNKNGSGPKAVAKYRMR